MWELVKEGWDNNGGKVLSNLVVLLFALSVLEETDEEDDTPDHLDFAVFQVPLWIMTQEFSELPFECSLVTSSSWKFEIAGFGGYVLRSIVGLAGDMIAEELVWVCNFNTGFFLLFYNGLVGLDAKCLHAHEEGQHYNIFNH
jgi:hypothetical protein